MENQVAFFNNVNQIIYDFNNMINNNIIVTNHIKETHFDKFNDTKSIVLNYTDYVNIDNNNNKNKLNIEINNNVEDYVIIVDVLTYNKLNITKFNNY